MTAWKQASERVFRKPISDWQRSFIQVSNPDAFGGRENYLLFLGAVLVYYMGRSPPETLRLTTLRLHLKQAWKGLRFEDPAIAMELDVEATVYRVPEAAILEDWLSSTFFVHKAPTRPEAWFAGKEKATTTELHYFPDHNSIALVASHWMYDFDGMFMTMQKLLQHLVEPGKDIVWGHETARLRPCFDELADIRETPDDETMSFVDNMFKTSYDAGAVAGLAIIAPVTPGITLHSRLILSPASTTEVITACKTLDLTITTAIHAACILATWEFAPTECKQLPQSVFIARDMRRLVERPLNDPDYAVNACLTGQIATIPKTDHFTDVTARLQPSYRLGRDATKVVSAAKAIQTQAVPWVFRPTDPKYPPTSAPLVSSLDLIDPWMAENYEGSNGKVKVTDLTTLGNLLIPQPSLWVCTFADKLHLMVSYNEANYEKRLFDRFLLRLVETLGEGLNKEIASTQ